jgi:hypothetical protein
MILIKEQKFSRRISEDALFKGEERYEKDKYNPSPFDILTSAYKQGYDFGITIYCEMEGLDD